MSNNRSKNSSITHVLVIDDNKDITEMLEEFFELEDIEYKVIMLE